MYTHIKFKPYPSTVHVCLMCTVSIKYSIYIRTLNFAVFFRLQTQITIMRLKTVPGKITEIKTEIVKFLAQSSPGTPVMDCVLFCVRIVLSCTTYLSLYCCYLNCSE